jgi:hypothetical protein
MEKPLGFSDTVASGSIKRISSFFIYMGFKSVDWIKVIKNKIPTKSLRRDSISFLLKCGYVIKL